MNGILSKEEARAFDLPLNPLQRHRRVAAYIKQVRESSGTEISVGLMGGSVKINGERIHVPATGPMLGRKALEHMAEAAEVIDYFQQYGLIEGEVTNG